MNDPREDLSILPPVLEEVRTPTLLNPSRLADLLRCPLSVIHGLREEELLPPHPLAVLGGIIHDVMHTVRSMTSKSRKETEDLVAEVFEERIRAAEVRLGAEPSTRRLVPIRRAVGRTAWRQRRSRLHVWANALSESSMDRTDHQSMRSQRRERRDRKEEAPATVRVPIGSEKPIKLPDYRLSGRPDRIERDSDGVFHITDLKSGSITNEEGQPLRDYALQVELYGLMVGKIDPDAHVRLWLEGSERVEVPWNDAARVEIEELLDEILSGLPEGLSLSAESLAKEGSHCARCRIRHRCPRYLGVAPEWWKGRSTTAPVAPFDVWGTVIDARSQGERSYEVTLRDVAGRKVRVSGLHNGPWDERLRSGDHVWFFDLEPSETLPHHGAFTHPRNFHGERASRVWSDALRLQIFIARR